MIFNKESALKIAEQLLQIKAIKLEPANPFQWASGWKSPIYCDNRVILSHPTVRTYIRQQFVEAINEHYPNAEVIAGVATGGIAHGVLVAQEMGLPFIYVRPSPKAHGMKNMIEGDIPTGKNVVVIEDLISTGGSSLKAVEALRDAECNVLGMLSIFSYGFDVAKKNFEKNKCKLITLSEYSILLEQVLEMGFISKKEISSLAEWNANPAEWVK